MKDLRIPRIHNYLIFGEYVLSLYDLYLSIYQYSFFDFDYDRKLSFIKVNSKKQRSNPLFFVFKILTQMMLL